jgi:hypothetical protein
MSLNLPTIVQCKLPFSPSSLSYVFEVLQSRKPFNMLYRIILAVILLIFSGKCDERTF